MAYQRKTADEYEIQGLYNGAWGCVHTVDFYWKAKQSLKDYRENERTMFKIVKKRVKIILA